MTDGPEGEGASWAVVEKAPLAEGVKAVWRIKLGLWFGLGLLVGAAYDIVNLFDDEAWLAPGIASGVFLVLLVSSVAFLPGFRYRFWWYSLTDEELVLERGILNRLRTIVPLRRVQHIDVSQDIIEREYDLGKLIVHTAGTRSSEVVLPGLQFNRAEQLRDRIKTYIHDEPV